MDINDLHPPDDYSHRFFIWHEWIQAQGPLTTENVLVYFATSMFYDKQSNNQVLRMQTQHSNATPMTAAEEANELKLPRRFVGIEFAVVHAEAPTFFIIQKRERLSPDEGILYTPLQGFGDLMGTSTVRPLAAYFIMNNRIYQSPDIYTVLSNRLLTSLSALQSSLDVLRRHRPDYTPRTGFVWPISVSDSSALDASKKRDIEANPTEGQGETDVEHERRSNTPKRQQNNMLLRHAMATTASHSKLSFVASKFAENIESMSAETPVTTTMRSSATPAPSTQETAQKTSGSQPSDVARVGVVKKKKKRISLAPPPAPS
uniref:Mediator of RNA polymerase II transcription subunit 6 n=1 Tax=Psilocybe cubensis TaxID=181762 RepID=A0A8H7Y6E0_PSICU